MPTPSDGDEPPPPDELDAACRRMLAETLRPCPELPRHVREQDRLEGRVRDAVLASWYGQGETNAVRIA